MWIFYSLVVVIVLIPIFVKIVFAHFNLGLSLDQDSGPANIFGARNTDELEAPIESNIGIKFELHEVGEVRGLFKNMDADASGELSLER